MNIIFSKKSGAILLEGLIVMTVITIIVTLIYSYLGLVRENTITKTHQERASFLLIETFEQLRSSRDSFLLHRRSTGWSDFSRRIKVSVEDEANTRFVMRRSSSNDASIGVIEGQWYVSPHAITDVVQTNISPYTDYLVYFTAEYVEDDPNQIVFHVAVSWGDIDDMMSSVEQDLLLTNHYIYENTY
ncbi:hypothetical protein COB57_03470 [Candidatus Peregrinibacteria bacterium]|nr:MAG: hypothetical protein COB57_03470 [Candidatus Peregrinibacteria bacterium]